MWLFTRLGFYSVTCPQEGEGLDVNRVQVRARSKEHLKRLQESYEEELGLFPIVETSDRDYICRMFVPKEVWAKVVMDLVWTIDYNNFKDVVHDDADNEEYSWALGRVWLTMFTFQEDANWRM